MEVLRVGNVNQAWPLAVKLIKEQGRLEDSRAGKVLVLDEPVMTEYLRPVERVLFCNKRDANPFFHLMEGFWMLSGSRRGAWLDQFVGDFSKRYAEIDGRLHGAYGYRWRNHFHKDQLKIIIQRLKKDNKDRRVVLSMWDPEFDLIHTNDPGPEPKDIPCNTHVYFRIVQGALDMTVMCRSNDIVWGCYGANVVHFSMLHEYMAAMIEVDVGIYRQMSNNWHGYLDTIPKETITECDPSPYPDGQKLVRDPKIFMHELIQFMANPSDEYKYRNDFFKLTAVPMFRASQLWRAKKREEAFKAIDEVLAMDWKIAAREWMLRRMK